MTSGGLHFGRMTGKCRLVGMIGGMALTGTVCEQAAASSGHLPRLQEQQRYNQRFRPFDVDGCTNESDGGPNGLMVCYSRSIDVAHRALPKTPANKQIRALMVNMSSSLTRAWWGEYSKRSEVYMVAKYGRWAVLRTVILTGGKGPRLPWRKPVSRSKPSFAWMADRALAARFERRWARIKDADCAAYPVPQCQQRLEEAYRLMLDGLVPERLWTRRRTPPQR